MDPSEMVNIIQSMFSKPMNTTAVSQYFEFYERESPVQNRKKLTAEILAEFDRQQAETEKQEQHRNRHAIKHTKRTFEPIEEQFQTDFSLEKIIQMHNKLWKEENAQSSTLSTSRRRSSKH